MYIKNPGHITKMAAIFIYGKNAMKSSSPEPVDQFQQNLACSMVDSVLQIRIEGHWVFTHLILA